VRAAASPSPTTTSPEVTERPDLARVLASEAERVLRRNWREGVHADGTAYAFTCPGAPRYRHQWHWDSCFNAIAWARFDAARARAELRTVLRSGRGDGFLPHTVFWDRPARWRRAPLYATLRLRGDRATESIGPPLLAWAWERVAAASPDEPRFAREALGALTAHLDWLQRERDPDGDGLLTILLPDESGLDDSPKYDPVFGRLVHYRPGYARLVQRCRRLGWRADRVTAAHDEHLEDVWVNVCYALSLRAMARLSGEARWSARAARTEAALLERCLDPATGLFLDLAGRDETPVRVSTWSALSPLLLESLPVAVRRRLVEEHVLDPRRYRATCGIPSVAMDEPGFRPGFDLWRTWRGPAWTNVTWLLVGPMRDLGYEEDAARVRLSLARAARAHGLREYYDPRTGRGLAARDFGWSALVADLAAPGEC
jgi:glycogen debranching enzyme